MGRSTSAKAPLPAPALLFHSLATVTGTVPNAHRRFVASASADALLKLLTVVGLVLLVPRMGIKAFALVMNTGSSCCLAAHILMSRESAHLISLHGTRERKDLRKILLPMGPLVGGALFSHVSGLVDSILASTLPSRHLSYLGCGKKLTDAACCYLTESDGSRESSHGSTTRTGSIRRKSISATGLP